MLTENFYTMIATMLTGSTAVPGDLYVAVGIGDKTWDTIPPDVNRSVMKLTRELARKRVTEKDITFLDVDGKPSKGPTTRLSISVRFGDGEAIGSLRECGLYGGGATDAADSGTLLSYYRHPVIAKTAAMSLQRVIRLDLSPSQVVAGSRVTRYLANVRTEELHDLENPNFNCQIDEIREDYRYYFATVEAALAVGYDRCGYCFGRALSAR